MLKYRAIYNSRNLNEFLTLADEPVNIESTIVEI